MACADQLDVIFETWRNCLGPVRVAFNELDDLLKESDYTVRRRKECQQMVESLSKASEIVSQVQ